MIEKKIAIGNITVIERSKLFYSSSVLFLHTLRGHFCKAEKQGSNFIIETIIGPSCLDLLIHFNLDRIRLPVGAIDGMSRKRRAKRP